MTESLIQRIEKAEKELAAIKAEAEKKAAPKVNLASLPDGVYVCLNTSDQPRIFLLEDGKNTTIFGDQDRLSTGRAPLVCRQGDCRGLQDSFDAGFYHSLKRVTSLAPLL